MLDQSELLTRWRAIRLLLLDVDGILTDGRLFYSSQGEELKPFNTQDGHGIKMLQANGVEVGIISGRSSAALMRRAEDLGITLVAYGREDKFTALEEVVLAERTLALSEIAFMGDDWPDLLVMTKVGLALTVADAHTEVLKRAHWISQRPGGGGAVREACDAIMQAQGTYLKALQQYT